MAEIRVVVAMSGGVDSSVAAALLKKKGYQVIGVTMCFNITEEKAKKPGCCGASAIDDAVRVAHKLGIRHYVLNMQEPLHKYVISNFCKEYLSGRTPNPCILCNQHLKFTALFKKVHSLGAQFLATGHYGRIEEKAGVYWLKKAKDLKKDQSYFLCRLNQPQLKQIIFPLGNYIKEEVRRIAKHFCLPVAEKTASQEICFLPRNDYREFLRQRCGKDIVPGEVLDQRGNILGQHKGIAYYTIGQREGLRIAKGYPVYITKINPRDNTITVGTKDDAFSRRFVVNNLSFINKPIKNKVVLKVKIRYNHKESAAKLTPTGNKISVEFKKPQFAITPGQAAVFYDQDKVVGSGTIEKVLE